MKELEQKRQANRGLKQIQTGITVLQGRIRHTPRDSPAVGPKIDQFWTKKNSIVVDHGGGQSKRSIGDPCIDSKAPRSVFGQGTNCWQVGTLAGAVKDAVGRT